MKRLPVVLITWADPCAQDGEGAWLDAATFEAEVVTCTTAGFLWKKSRAFVTIVGSFNDVDQIGGVITIPRACIRSMVTLRR